MFTYHSLNFPYLYDCHVHTSEGSACGKNTGSEMAQAYKAAGYSGIVITDHFYYGNTAIDRDLPWPIWVDHFSKGYENAKATGLKIGLQVFFGWEACYEGTEFLIYGLSPSWLLAHPEIKNATISEQFHLIKKDGGLVIQAHPFREESYIDAMRLFPDLVDGIEVLNATHSNPHSLFHYNPHFDKEAAQYAKAHHFLLTAGSDMHNTDLLGGGIAFSHPLQNEKDFVKAITSKETYLLTNGHHSFEQSSYYEAILSI